ncbi:hypothetical protein N7493_008832 [Penicillium malachiteum]|uniref:Uncharacterized protein n=1 Tax=Penicillium malachiteum TaxID=1324776 RepID=A0AAD6HFB9_9EURO|nr:hypothetical protein N7493_008832 [Penicillium malachiteum]
MILSRRIVVFLGVSFFLVLLYTARHLSQPWHKIPQSIGLGEFVYPVGNNRTKSFNLTFTDFREDEKTLYAPQPNFIPGIPKPPGYEYTKTLVIPRMQSEDVSWIEQELPDWQTAIYVADDPSAPLHPPKNKGHEVMVYLSFVIDFYDNLPDVAVFMHSHQEAWHNDEIFGGDAAEILRRLSLPRVIREGYMNTRCTFAPGCPAWMHPGTVVENEQKQEETMLARAWGELFPDDPVPSVLAQPCCAQFALSRDRIRTIPRARFIFYRDWLLQTDLSDYIAGRIWEYLWQYIFTGEAVVCVMPHICLCDGYGVCFGGQDPYDKFRLLFEQKTRAEEQLGDYHVDLDELDLMQENDETEEEEGQSISREARLIKSVREKRQMVQELIDAALVLGEDPQHRAMEAGRPWKVGDGF